MARLHEEEYWLGATQDGLRKAIADWANCGETYFAGWHEALASPQHLLAYQKSSLMLPLSKPGLREIQAA